MDNKKLFKKLRQQMIMLHNMYDKGLEDNKISFVQKKAVQHEQKKLKKLIDELDMFI